MQYGILPKMSYKVKWQIIYKTPCESIKYNTIKTHFIDSIYFNININGNCMFISAWYVNWFKNHRLHRNDDESHNKSQGPYWLEYLIYKVIKYDGQLAELCYEVANIKMLTEMKSIFCRSFLKQESCSQMNTENFI